MSRRIGILLALLMVMGGLGMGNSTRSAAREAAEALPPNSVIQLVPDQMLLVGDVATQANTVGQCTEPWLADTPVGAIILGVAPTSCQPEDWGGGTATAALYLSASAAGVTIYTLEIFWPDRDGKGLHSPLRNRAATILWDGQAIWDKRTTELSTFGDYYAAEHVPIATSIVVTQSVTHTLTIQAPAHTAWDISQIVITAQPTPTGIRGVGYSPYRDCQYPGGVDLPSLADIDDDLRRLFHTSNAIRTYAAGGINGVIPARATGLGLLTFPGAWLDCHAGDEAEIEALISLANTQPVDGLIVGNEVYLRHRAQDDLDYLLQRIQQVRAQVPATIPLMSAEIDNLMFNWSSSSATIPTGINPLYRPILDEVDYVLVHIYPFWSELPIEGAAHFTVERYLAMQALLAQEYPGEGKRLIIGESGWPSQGGSNGAAIPNLPNARRYYLEFLHLAAAHDVEYFYFDAFDELWKIEEPGGVGQHWGYSYSDRSAKHPEYGLFLPPDILAERVDAATAAPHSVASSGSPQATSTAVFTVYNEWPPGPDHFVPTGWMGDLEHINLYECDREYPFDGALAARASFTPGGPLGWGGIYWLYPENNWGTAPEGLDLRQANHLRFWARGQQGGERVRFVVGGIGAQDDPYPESLRPAASTGFVALSDTWQHYTIDLRGRDLTHVIGGFAWVTDQCANPAGAVFYLDKIEFGYDPDLPPPPPPSSISILPVYTDAAQPDNHFAPTGFMDAAANPNNIQLTECWYQNPHRGETAIRVQYTHNPGPEQYGGGVYWVDPAENWGDRPGGIDLRYAARLTFWARSEVTAPLKIMLGGVGYEIWDGITLCDRPSGAYPDSLCPKIETTIQLTPIWQQYTINLQDYPRDYQRVVGGFGWYATQSSTFYLDDIQYEYDWYKVFLPLILRSQ